MDCIHPSIAITGTALNRINRIGASQFVAASRGRIGRKQGDGVMQVSGLE
ncbi:MAG: hypothetical protein U1F20_06255 [Lysobacterales bacterium]